MMVTRMLKNKKTDETHSVEIGECECDLANLKSSGKHSFTRSMAAASYWSVALESLQFPFAHYFSVLSS